MILPSTHTCEACGSAFSARYDEVCRDSFQCPVCGDLPLSQKKKMRKDLRDIALLVILTESSRSLCIDFDDSDVLSLSDTGEIRTRDVVEFFLSHGVPLPSSDQREKIQKEVVEQLTAQFGCEIASPEKWR